MAKLMEFPLEDGTVVLIAVHEEQRETGRVAAGIAPRAVEKAGQSLERALDSIRPFLLITAEKFKSAAESADEIQIEFGIGFSAKAQAFIASADTQTSLKVGVSWKRSK
jgi:hypothetical protein